MSYGQIDSSLQSLLGASNSGAASNMVPSNPWAAMQGQPCWPPPPIPGTERELRYATHLTNREKKLLLTDEN